MNNGVQITKDGATTTITGAEIEDFIIDELNDKYNEHGVFIYTDFGDIILETFDCDDESKALDAELELTSCLKRAALS